MDFEPRSATMMRTTGHSWAAYAPHPAIARWVSCYWTLDTDGGAHVVRTLPDASIDLTFRFTAISEVFIAGAQTRANEWQHSGETHLLGARLAPGAAAALGIDASALSEGWTPLDSVLPKEIVAPFVRRMHAAADVRERVTQFDAFLSNRLLNRALDERLSKALAHVFASSGDVSVADLARVSGAHSRTLGRLFDAAVGLSPKRFARIVRLQTALRGLEGSDNWAHLAADLGYHDQAHFIHDVRDLFNATPSELVQLAPNTR